MIFDKATAHPEPIMARDGWPARLADRAALIITPRSIELAEAGEIGVEQPGRVLEPGRRAGLIGWRGG